MTRHRTLRGFAALLAVPALVVACGGGTATLPSIPPATPVPSAAPSASAAPHATTSIPESCPKAQPAALPAGETRTVTIVTPQGSFAIKVEADLSPIAAGNFVALVECGYYMNVVIHRIAPNFVIQAGDGQFGREPNVYKDLVGSGGPGYTIADEPVTADYTRGTVAMAKTRDPNSAGSQFFVVLADASLPKQYQIFGHVTSGMDVVDAISNMPNDGSDISLAVDPVAMTSLSVAKP